jgi:2-polyprenyl-6-methoxyphenol hydroxylase-like FAD-dependent oxidoreductase
MRVLIIGGGVAGSTAFHALKRIGALPVLFERAPALLPVGAGITLAPNGLHILAQLGLLPAVQRISAPNLTVTAYDSTGQIIGGCDFSGIERRFGHALLGMSRHDLQLALHETLPTSSVVFGRTAVRVESDAECARVHFDDGSVEVGDVVLGADGARSVTSSFVSGQGGESLLRPTGFVCNYGMTAPGAFPSQNGAVTWVYNEGLCWGSWCLPDKTQRDGGIHFWFSVHRWGHGKNETAINAVTGSWRSGPEQLALHRASFSGMFHPAPGGFDAILAASPQAVAFGLADKVAGRFARGRIALLGDAARTVTPWGGQGANMAIEDAAALANALADAGPAAVQAGLRAYESSRKFRSTAVSAFSRQTGGIQMMTGASGQLARRISLALPSWAVEASLGWLYGHKMQLQIRDRL